MAKPTIAIHNAETGETEYREMTDAEFFDFEEMNKAEAKLLAEKEAEAKIRAEAKASALAKLTALGLSEEEAKAIAG